MTASPTRSRHWRRSRSRDLPRRAEDVPQPAHVQERLLQRQPLHHRRGLAKDREQLAARRRVGVEVGVHGDQVRAERPRPRPSHPPADPVLASLIARRHHHPGPDDGRLPPQARVVPLRDRREEGVSVGVQDRRFHGCEHMFASQASQGKGARLLASRGLRLWVLAQQKPDPPICENPVRPISANCTREPHSGGTSRESFPLNGS